ncbi:MAG: hypothetical protein IJ193_09395 [Bacilli bacterium]|nr:hypothetical protein [Bacilli bacterium]
MTVFNYFPFQEDEVELNHRITRKSKAGFMLYKTPALEREECDITTYLRFKSDYNDIIKEFNDTMEENFTKEKNAFNRNIKTLKIVESKNNIFHKAIDHFRGAVEQGSYSDYHNEIEIRLPKEEHKKKVKSVVMHELIHMSSSVDKVGTGFHQSNIEKSPVTSLGRGINEGYTEKLNQEYFSKYIDRGVYDYEIVLAGGIERIVGKKEMQKLYFNADLRGLLRGINHYVNDMNKVANLIYDIDKLDSIRNEIKREDEYQRLRNEISEIYSKKLDLEYSLNLINEEQYERKKFFYIDQFVERGIAYSDNVKMIEKSAIYWIEDGPIKDFIKKDKEKIKFRPDEVDTKEIVPQHNIDNIDELFEAHPVEDEYDLERKSVDEIKQMLQEENPNRAHLMEVKDSKREVIEMLDDYDSSSISNNNKYAK